MHKYYTDRSLLTRWDKKISGSISQDVLKNRRRSKDHRAFYYPIPELKKIESECVQKSQICNLNIHSKNSILSKEIKSKHQKYDNLLNKISTLPIENSNLFSNFERMFKKNIMKNMKNMKSLENFEVISKQEQEDIVKDYSNSARAKMFTLKKSGAQFRRTSLRKLIAERKIQ